MEDNKILDLFFERSENAIAETSKKYSNYCHAVSFNILHNNEDAQECVNDTYMRAWNVIPPNRPQRLSTFLGKIVRNLSINKFNQYHAEKRNFGQIDLALNELEECISTNDCIEKQMDTTFLTQVINRFLKVQQKETRVIFIKRYWHLYSVSEISKQCNMSESKVKSILFRTRNKLKLYLEKEGISI